MLQQRGQKTFSVYRDDIQQLHVCQGLLDAMQTMVVCLNKWAVAENWNRVAVEYCQKLPLQGKTFMEFASHWDNPSERQREIMYVVRTKCAHWQSLECAQVNGEKCWFHVDKIPIRERNDSISGVLLVISNVSQLVEQRAALRQVNERYRTFIANSQDAIWRYGIQPSIATSLPIREQLNHFFVSAKLQEANQRLLEFASARAIKNLMNAPVSSQHAWLNKHVIYQFIINGYRLEGYETELTDYSGNPCILESNIYGEVDNGKLVRCWGTSRDITKQKNNTEKMQFLIEHDELTSLPNRNHLHSELTQVLEARRPEQTVALLLIDLDRFKEVNDTLGHTAGDELLKLLGARLADELSELQGMLGRLGGDEFAILLPNIRNRQQAVVLAHRFLDTIIEEFELDGVNIEIGASIGIAIAPDHTEDATTLLRYADIAMYNAKKVLKGVSVYDADFDTYSPKRLGIVSALGRAIRQNHMRLYFQPKIDLRNHKTHGFEALIRWLHPENGLVPPNDFIPVAEVSSAIYALTNWVLEETIKHTALWLADGRDVVVAMNLSARNLLDERIVNELGRLLRKYALPGNRLEMEITESMIMADPLRAQSILEKISAYGVQLSVDDYGTGYSSLAYLKRLPVSALKIDCSFVKNMMENEHDQIIVSSTIQLAHNLGLKVVAEGVETQAIYDRLAALGCDYAQGYFMSRPMDASHTYEWLLSKP